MDLHLIIWTQKIIECDTKHFHFISLNGALTVRHHRWFRSIACLS